VLIPEREAYAPRTGIVQITAAWVGVI